ncbi:restriction endonuclease subunit S [Bacteroides cellulolyticus]|uniref:restriction endonuclease subunit S n=1 Tax=Bacteroides cellulolyticus TaxID=2981780 RepID=UPI0012AB4940|nr:restriction endonuclease subunit S [Bacteroides cellulolyticus]
MICNVPNLRFPEFTNEWGNITIKEACSEFQSGKNIKAEMITGQGLYPVYGGNGLRGFTESYNHDGDYILIGRQGALCGNIRKVTGKTYVTEHAIAVCASKENETTFLQYLFQKMKLGQYSDQSAQPGLAVNKLLRLNINVPSKIEQAKIAKILSLIDERIITQNKIIEKYESLIQAIIYQKKMDGIREGNWQKTELSKVLQERTEKNINGYTVCSVSVSQGVINQIEYLGRSFAAKETSHYNIVKYGDIVYTKSPTGDFPYGIVKRCYIKNAVAVSPLYGVYKPINDNIGVFLHFYFMQSNNAFNYLHPLIQKGAKNTINITNARFLENSIPLPKTEDEVVYIANALTSIQTKIDVEKSLLCSYEKEKQYLLRQMFI